MGFGDLIVDNASEVGGTIVMHNINKPRHYADLLLRELVAHEFLVSRTRPDCVPFETRRGSLGREDVRVFHYDSPVSRCLSLANRPCAEPSYSISCAFGTAFFTSCAVAAIGTDDDLEHLLAPPYEQAISHPHQARGLGALAADLDLA